MNFEFINLAIENNIAFLTLNNQKFKNAMNTKMAQEILECLNNLGSARVLVINSLGDSFCSGAQIDFSNPKIDLGQSLIEIYNPVFIKLKNLEIPIITSVNGAAAGIGASFALMGDIIIASKSAYFLQAFINLGLIPDGGAAFILAKSIGRVRAMELMLLGERLSAEQAYTYNLITKVCEDSELTDIVNDYANRISNGPNTAYKHLRQLLWNALENDFETSLSLEAKSQSELGKTQDFYEGIMSFISKKKPNFKGV